METTSSSSSSSSKKSSTNHHSDSSSPTYFVFDFDCTISSRHTYFFLNVFHIYTTQFRPPPQSEEDVDFLSHLHRVADKLKHTRALNDAEKSVFIEELFDGPERLEVLRSFFESLKARQYHLIIASRGNREQIMHCLRTIGFDDLFEKENIYDNATNKTTLILELLQQKHANVFYIDDTHDEHRLLLEHHQQLMKMDDENISSKHFESFKTDNGLSYIFCRSLPNNGSGMTTDLMDIIEQTLQQDGWGFSSSSTSSPSIEHLSSK